MQSSPSQESMPRYVLANAGAILAGLTAAYFALAHSGPVTFIKWSDFIAFFSAARLVVEGHGAQIYDFHALKAVQAPLYHPYRVPDGFMVYIYPPFLALIMAPFALLPYAAAYAVRLATNLVLLAIALYWLERYAGLSGRKAVAARWCTFVFLPVFVTLIQGQTALLLLVLFTGALLALQSGRGSIAGLLLSLVLVKPPYVLPVLLVLLLRKEWPALKGFAAGAAALILVPVPVLGVSTIQAYVRTLAVATSWHNQFGYEPKKNNSLFGFFELLLPGRPAMAIAALLCLLLLAALAACAWRAPQLDLPFAAAVACVPLVNPHVLIHDLSLLLLPAYVLLRYRQQLTGALPWLLVAGYVLITLGYPLSFNAPLQLSVPVTAVLAIGILRLGLFSDSPEALFQGSVCHQL